MKELIKISKQATKIQFECLDDCKTMHQYEVDPDDSKKIVYIPTVEWCLEQIKNDLLMADFNFLGCLEWRILYDTAEDGTEIFQHPNLNICAILACEYVLSGGKNDLRSEI